MQKFTISIVWAIQNMLKFSFRYSQFVLPSLKKWWQGIQIHLDFLNVHLTKISNKTFQCQLTSFILFVFTGLYANQMDSTRNSVRKFCWALNPKWCVCTIYILSVVPQCEKLANVAVLYISLFSSKQSTKQVATFRNTACYCCNTFWLDSQGFGWDNLLPIQLALKLITGTVIQLWNDSWPNSKLVD